MAILKPVQNVGASADSMADLAPVDSLSILVQGGLFQDNIVQTATNCRHWRELFPQAEILLSISVTNIITGQVQPDRVLLDVALAAHLAHDGPLQVALQTILETCDRLVLSEGGLPLPKSKTDTHESNINLQIAAAQAGLKQVSGRYVLRTRSDLIFLDQSFVEFYLAYADVPRSGHSVLSQRVMISEIFTVNPLTFERLPFHFSDWFHFGLTEDVQRLWNVRPMTLQDQLYYIAHPHAADTNPAESFFTAKLAAEQYLTVAALGPNYPDLRLNYHNDQSSIDLSMDVLLDEFIVCDLVRCHVYMPRYMHDVVDPRKDVDCVRGRDWIALARDRGIDPRDHFRHAIRTARKELFVRYDPGMKPVRLVVKHFNRVRRKAAHGYAALRSLLVYSRL